MVHCKACGHSNSAFKSVHCSHCFSPLHTETKAAHTHGSKFRAVAYSKKDEKKKRPRLVEETEIREEAYVS